MIKFTVFAAALFAAASAAAQSHAPVRELLSATATGTPSTLPGAQRQAGKSRALWRRLRAEPPGAAVLVRPAPGLARELVAQAIAAGTLHAPTGGAPTWLSELVWRDFYFMILDRFPYSVVPVAKGVARTDRLAGTGIPTEQTHPPSNEVRPRLPTNLR